MKKIILSESQSIQLAKMLNEENVQVQQMPVDKKMNKPYTIDPEKVLVVKKYLNSGFSVKDYEDVGPNGYRERQKIIFMNASNGQPLKMMYPQQLLDLLIDKFQNIYADKTHRFLFLRQVLRDWMIGKIGPHGTLSVNILSEATVTSDMVDERASEANTEPTEKQKEAGNYKMGHISIKGMPISIENPKGSFRSGTDENGRKWRTELKNHYGYFTNTTGNGKDGDAVDVFIGPHTEDFSRVYVVDQKVKGEFDESKVMLGFYSKEDAKNAYLSNYDENWKGFWKITGVSLSVFKRWLYRNRKQRKPFADYVSIRKHRVNESLMIGEVNDENSLCNILEILNSKGVPVKRDGMRVCISEEFRPLSQATLDEMQVVASKTISEYAKRHPEFKYEEIGTLNEDISPMQMYQNVLDVPEHGKERREIPNESWVRVRGEHGKMNLKNEETGELLSEQWFDWIGHMVNGVAIVRMGDKGYNLINDKGELIFPKWYDDILEPNIGTDSSGEYVIIDGGEKIKVKI